MKYQLILLSVLFSFLWAPLSAQNSQSKVLKGDTSSRILFLTFHIKKTATNPDGELVLTGSKIFPGRYRQTKDTTVANGKKGQLMVLLKNASGQTMTQSIIENPLAKHAEYVKEDGQLGDTTDLKNETDFTVRLPYYEGCQLSEIRMFKEDRKAVKISSLAINQDK